MKKEFYNGFMNKISGRKKFTVIEIEGLPKVALKEASVPDIQSSGLLMGDFSKMGEVVVDYMISKLVEYNEETGETGENVFSAGNKDQLMENWGELHMKVYEVLGGSIAESVGKNTKES